MDNKLIISKCFASESQLGDIPQKANESDFWGRQILRIRGKRRCVCNVDRA